MKQITVMGLGYIGLPTAITMAQAGYPVVGFDVSAPVIETLQGGKIHIVEPGLQEAFTAALESGNLTFSTDLPESDVYYISVPTPFYRDEEGRQRADLSYVESAGRMAGRAMRPDSLVILESTVPPRTTEMLARVLSEESGVPMKELHVAHCPERIIPGNMLYELKNNDRIIGARTPEAAQMAREIYENVLESGVCRVTDDITAEMCKLTENTYRDVNIAFANELSVLCDQLGIDVFELIRLANCHPRVNILSPGVGVGGHCIAVDPWFLCEQFPKDAKDILACRQRNDDKPRFVAEKVMGMVDKLVPTIAVLGLSYKADVDDLRESPSIELCHLLQHKGARVLGVEPYVQESMIDGIDNVPLEQALREADLTVITLQHRLFRENKASIAAVPHYDCVGLLHQA